MAGIDGEATSDPEDVPAIIARYREDAYRLARHLVRSSAEAEDLTQTAILNVLRRAEHISDASYVRAYLLTTVRNLWRNQLRARGNRRFVGSDIAETVPSPDRQPDDHVLESLDAALAQSALESLSATSREILELRYVEGMDFPALAHKLSITPVAARQRAHRAREELIGACMDHTASAGSEGCRPIRRRLGRYHRGLLGTKLRRQITAHLDACKACSSCYEQLVDLYGQRIPGSTSIETDV
jgi:RNA polymerase sigma-70 factor (ECF subfamily)